MKPALLAVSGIAAGSSVVAPPAALAMISDTRELTGAQNTQIRVLSYVLTGVIALVVKWSCDRENRLEKARVTAEMKAFHETRIKLFGDKKKEQPEKTDKKKKKKKKRKKKKKEEEEAEGGGGEGASNQDAPLQPPPPPAAVEPLDDEEFDALFG
jgi:hypothetical protein